MNLPPSLQAHLKTFCVAYAILLGSLLLTCAAYFGHAQSSENRDYARFSQEAQASFEQVEAQLQVFVTMMKGVRALYSASPNPAPRELERYFRVLRMEDLQQDKGLEGIGIVYPVRPGERAQHLAAMRRQQPGYRLKTHTTNTVAYPLVYLEKLGYGMEPAPIGWDLGQNAIRREALDRSLRSGQPAMSAPTPLLYWKETNRAPGFVFYLPIFKAPEPPGTNSAAVAGFVFCAFDSQKLWNNLFSHQYRDIDIEIYDGETTRAENLLFDRDRRPAAGQAHSVRFHRTKTSEVFGRRWTFLFQSNPRDAGAFEEFLPPALFTLGVAGSFLLFGFACVQAIGRATAGRLTRGLQKSESATRQANDELARKVAEAEQASALLRESESLYQSLVQTLPQCVYRKDLQGRFTFANAAFRAAFPLGPGDLAGKTERDIFPECLARKNEQDDARIVETAQSYSTVHDYQRSPGETRFLQVVKTPLFDQQGAIAGIQGVFWDITGNKLAESKLGAEKERLAVTLRSIGDAVVATDTEGQVQLLNPVAEQLAEQKQARAIGQKIETVFALRDAQTGQEQNGGLLQWLQDKPSPAPKPALFIAPSGRQFLLQKRVAPIRDESGRTIGAVFVFRDVTQERKIEEELLRASKLESIGLLAGGIAHDFNNILTGIVGHLSLLRENPALPADVSERLALLERTAYKARQLTLQLLTFAKGGSPIKQTASISEVVRESAEFALRGSNVRPEFAFAPDLSPVEIDTGQMGQVIQNLVINSKQAMPDGGTIEISAGNCRLDRSVNLPLPAGRYVRISIRDSGQGIRRENLPKIFDPYFTTKSGGSGLGLATAYSVMKRHDGLITVESDWGRGSTFHLYLPASAAQPPPPPAEPPPGVPGGGRILVMDDEPAIRSLLTAILRHFGCTSTAVEHGEAAIREYRQAIAENQPYAAVIMDLTILDLTIPGGMGGREAVAELLRIDPGVRAIVSSGYSNDPVLAEFRKYGFVARVEKPYRLPELAAVLATVLRGPAGAQPPAPAG